MALPFGISEANPRQQFMLSVQDLFILETSAKIFSIPGIHISEHQMLAFVSEEIKMINCCEAAVGIKLFDEIPSGDQCS